MKLLWVGVGIGGGLALVLVLIIFAYLSMKAPARVASADPRHRKRTNSISTGRDILTCPQNGSTTSAIFQPAATTQVAV